MSTLKTTEIHPGVALSCTKAGEWRRWAKGGLDGSWFCVGYGFCPGSIYALDFAALRLRNTEAFIVAVATISAKPIADFDEAAVREIIKWANENWELQ